MFNMAKKIHTSTLTWLMTERYAVGIKLLRTYSRSADNQQIGLKRYTHDDILELFVRVLENGQIWVK